MGIQKDGVYYEAAPYKSCEHCGRRYQPGAYNWHNHFLCSVRCCNARRAERNPPERDDGDSW